VDFPRVHFYDHDLADMYEFTFNRLRESWKKGNPENGFQGRYLSHPGSDRINQFETCLASFFLVYSNRTFPVLSLLDNFYARQEKDGAIRGEYSDKDGRPLHVRGNPEGVLPPLFAWAEYNIYHKIGLKKRVKDVVPVLEAHYTWLESTFKRENGLYAVPLEGVHMGNAPRADVVYPVDFNAQQALNALYLSALGDVLNDKEKSYRFKKHYFSLKTRINSMMWSEEDSTYYDLDAKERQVPSRTLASYWTLLAEVPSKDRSERFIAHLSDPAHFGVENPFPSTAASHKQYDRKGGGFRGSVFPHLTFMVIKGLEKYGKFELARESAIRHLYYILDSLHHDEGTGTLWEAYQPQHEGPASWPRHDGFPRRLFLPYAALATITLMIENVVGLYISLPRKTVDWIVPTIEIMGIENLALKRNMITILSNQSGRGWEIRLESEKLYYFTINLLNNKKKTLPIPSGKCSILIDKL
jgi:neutral trehalase